MKSFTARRLYVSGFLICVILLAASYYFEFIQNMQPCLLCILQRWAFIALAMIFLVAAIHAPQHWGRHIYLLLLLAAAGVGIFAAARQVWLQHQPPETSAHCLPSLPYLLKICPLPQVIHLLLLGGPDCAQITWRLWGFTMPEWTLAAFIGLTVLIVMAGWREVSTHNSGC